MIPAPPPGRRVAVVGAGIVGLSTAHALLKDGAAVTLIDRAGICALTSAGNAGCIAVTSVLPETRPHLLAKLPRWLLSRGGEVTVRPRYALQALPWLVRFALAARSAPRARATAALTALNATVYSHLIPLLREAGVEPDLHRAGSLELFETERAWQAAQAEYAEKRRLGVSVETVPAAELPQLEPAIARTIRHAAFFEDWSHVSDPRRIGLAIGDLIRRLGATFQQREVVRVAADGRSATLAFADGEAARFDQLVIAGGVWSRALAAQLGDRLPLDTERGYNITVPDPGIALSRNLQFPEHAFVATPLSVGLRVGGLVEIAGTRLAPDFRLIDGIVKTTRRFLPGFRRDGGVTWMGMRPALPDSLPVIGLATRHGNVAYAFGHSHLGLTQAAPTGRLVADLLAGRPPIVDPHPFRPDRF
ncbi:MAG: FAD-binding oxidoreductase [Azospirillaceae bacterium]